MFLRCMMCVFLALVGLSLFAAGAEPAVGDKVPQVISQDLDGKETRLSDHLGKVVVLDIGATWCLPCRMMIPEANKLVTKMKGRPFVFISVWADQQRSTVKEFEGRNPMPWTHWWNGPKGGLITDWNVRFFPTIYVIDHQGVVAYKDVKGDRLERAIVALVEKAEKEQGEIDWGFSQTFFGGGEVIPSPAKTYQGESKWDLRIKSGSQNSSVAVGRLGR